MLKSRVQRSNLLLDRASIIAALIKLGLKRLDGINRAEDAGCFRPENIVHRLTGKFRGVKNGLAERCSVKDFLPLCVSLILVADFVEHFFRSNDSTDTRFLRTAALLAHSSKFYRVGVIAAKHLDIVGECLFVALDRLGRNGKLGIHRLGAGSDDRLYRSRILERRELLTGIRLHVTDSRSMSCCSAGKVIHFLGNASIAQLARCLRGELLHFLGQLLLLVTKLLHGLLGLLHLLIQIVGSNLVSLPLVNKRLGGISVGITSLGIFAHEFRLLLDESNAFKPSGTHGLVGFIHFLLQIIKRVSRFLGDVLQVRADNVSRSASADIFNDADGTK